MLHINTKLYLYVIILMLITPAVQAVVSGNFVTNCLDQDADPQLCPSDPLPQPNAPSVNGIRRFIKLDKTGSTVSDNVTEHACVQDNMTGLIWEIKTHNGDLQDKNWTYTWYSSGNEHNTGVKNGGRCYNIGHCDTAQYIIDINTMKLCGFSDWRLPNSRELLTIIDTSRYSPMIDKTYFPNTILVPGFWTSSVTNEFHNYSWIIHFGYGYLGYSHHGYAYGVRLVRTIPRVGSSK